MSILFKAVDFRLKLISFFLSRYGTQIRRMKFFEWNEEKNRVLKESINISFEEIVLAIDTGQLLNVVEHHDKSKYPDQKLLIVEVQQYAFVVPFTVTEDTYFLKTIYPGRKATQKYINKEK